MRIVFFVFLILPGIVLADPVPFDLAGPKLEVKVTRAGITLPISEVPNLAVGDRLWIKANLPPNQSAHYLLVAAFLQGSTNPPPEHWFFSSETWNRKAREGLNITVPDGAQQVILFLAPETNGDFKTLVGAVRGRPGAFVRASQDLNQVILDRARLKAYLSAISRISQTDYEQLPIASPLLARSLSVKFDPNCLEKIPELQAPCLMHGQDTLVLDDGHSASIVSELTTGNSADLIMQLGYTPQADYGFNSPYIASAMDIARIMDSFHTAQYRYIPALATEEGDQLSLELNTAPSFHNPKSVIVTALPAVEAPQMPPLRPVDPKGVYCAEKTELVLPAEGAPLVFATGYAHDMVLRLKGKNGKIVDLPVKADAEKGGFVANTRGLSPSNYGDALDGSLHGYWGFEPYDGPEFRLENEHPQHWEFADGDQELLVAGKDATVHIETENAACVDSILLQKPAGGPVKADWKSTGPNQVAVTVPLKKVKPGAMKLLIKQYGSSQPDTIAFEAFAPAGHLESFDLHASDSSGVLKGSQLRNVKELTLNGIQFKPSKTDTAGNGDELPLTAEDAKAAEKLTAGDELTANVTLRDGRVLSLDTTIGAPRPVVTLIGTSVEPSAATASGNLHLTDQGEVPQGALLTFSLHAQIPEEFSGDEKVEVATAHGAYLATLTMANGLTLEDSHIALATLDTAKAFASSAAGPLRFRIVEKGDAGNWQPLATLVRLPALSDLKCPADPDQLCKLTGSKLFLVDSIADDAQFTHPIPVPEGFPGYSLSVPRPIGGELYVKLHDDPYAVNSVSFPAFVPAVPAEAAKPPAPPANPPSPAVPLSSGPAESTGKGAQVSSPDMDNSTSSPAINTGPVLPVASPVPPPSSAPSPASLPTVPPNTAPTSPSSSQAAPISPGPSQTTQAAPQGAASGAGSSNGSSGTGPAGIP